MSTSRPPRWTTSSGLFAITLIFVGGISFWYEYGVEKQSVSGTVEQKVTILYVKAGDDVKKILETIPGPMEVRISAAVFPVEETIYLHGKNGLVLKGEGEGATIRCTDGSVFILEDCAGFHLENLTLQCESPGHAAMRIIHGSKIGMHQLKFQASGAALSVDKNSEDQNSREIVLKNSDIDSKVYIANTEQIFIVGNRMRSGEEVQDAILEICDSTDFTLERNEIKAGTGCHVVRVKSAANDNSVWGNNFTTSHYALKLEDSSRFLIEANYVKSEHDSAVIMATCENIRLGGNRESERRNDIKSTKISALTMSGCKSVDIADALLLNGPDTSSTTVRIEFCSWVKVENTQIHGYVKEIASGGGMVIHKSEKVTVKKNQIYDGSNNGIAVENESGEIEIYENTVRHHRQDGIVVENSQAVIANGNKISQNYVGIHLINPREKTNILNNSIFENKDNGITMDKAPGKGSPVIMGNEIKNNEANGVEIIKSSPSLRDNQIIGNEGYGIRIDQVSTIAENENNKISENLRGPMSR